MPTVPKMTDLSVKALKAPPGGRIEYFDPAYPGLALRVSGPSGRSQGRKAWVDYVRVGGKQRKLTLGTYPGTTLADARNEATKAQQEKRQGIDPHAVREQAKAAAIKAALPRETFADVAELWIERKLVDEKRAPGYIYNCRRNLANHVLPSIGDREIADITKQDVTLLLDRVYKGGKACATSGHHRGGGGPYAANRTLAMIKSIFAFAEERGSIDRNPVTMRRMAKENIRERTLDDSELAIVLQAIETLGTPYREYYKFLAYVPCRRDEARKLEWSELKDNQDGTMTWTQTTNKSKRPHSLILPPTVTATLKAMPRIKLGRYVFSVSTGKPFAGLSALKQRLDAKTTELNGAPIPHWQNHDLRRSGATNLVKLEVPIDHVGRVLNHAPKGVTLSVYVQHDFAKEKAEALSTLADHMDGLHAHTPPTPKVVSLKRRA